MRPVVKGIPSIRWSGERPEVSIEAAELPTAQAATVAYGRPSGHVWPAMTSETIGDRLRRYRRARGLSQRKLAETSGVSRQFIAELERNAVTIPREPDNVRLLATTLGVTMKELAGPTGWYDADVPGGPTWEEMLRKDNRLDAEAKAFLERAIRLEFEAAERDQSTNVDKPHRKREL